MPRPVIYLGVLQGMPRIPDPERLAFFLYKNEKDALSDVKATVAVLDGQLEMYKGRDISIGDDEVIKEPVKPDADLLHAFTNDLKTIDATKRLKYDQNGVIVFNRVAGDANRTDDLALCIFERYAAGEGDQPAVRVLDVIQRAARLRELTNLAGVHVEVASRACFLHRDVDRTKPCAVHPGERLEVDAGVDHGNIHLRTDHF